jgi:hypothetical protein
VAVVRASGVLAQSDVGEFDPTLREDSHLIVGTTVVGRTRVKGQFGMILRVAPAAFDERLLG